MKFQKIIIIIIIIIFILLLLLVMAGKPFSFGNYQVKSMKNIF